MHLHIASFVLLALTGSVTVLADGLNGRQPIFVSEVGIRTPLSSFVGDESSGGVSSRSSIQSTEEDEKRYLLNIRSNGRKAGPEFTADVNRLCAAIEGCTHALSEWGIISSNKPLSHLAKKIIGDSKLISIVEKVVPARKIFLNATLVDPKKRDLKGLGAKGGAKSDKGVPAGWSSSPTRDANNYFWHTDRIDSYGLGYDNASYSLSRGKGVHIYVLDTGINPRDPRLFTSFDPGAKSRLVEAITTLVSAPYTYSDKTIINVDLGGGHGTHVMGLAGGLQTSVAPEASLHAIKVFGVGDGAYDDDILGGMYHAYETIPKGARGIVSMSLGAQGRSSLYVTAVEALKSKGIVTVLAAGNSDTNACGFSPAFSHNAVTVGASDISDNAAYFSNFGPCIDIWAPGVDDKSIFFQVENSTELMSGTSMAAPVTAGAVATLLSAAPDITVPSVGRLLQISGSPSIQASPDMAYFSEFAPTTDKLVFTRPLQFQPMTVSASLVRVPGSGPAKATFKVSLKQKFASNVVVQLSPSDSDRANVKPSTVTFTPKNWKKAQTITITMKPPTNNNGKFVPGPASKVGESFFIDLVATSASFDLNPPYAYYVVEVADDRVKEYGSSTDNAIPVTSIPYEFAGDLRSFPPATAHWQCKQDSFISQYPWYLYDIRDMLYEENLAIFKFEPSKFDYCKNKPTCGLQFSTCKSASFVRLNLVEESKVATLGSGSSMIYSLEGLCTGELMMSPGEPCAFYQGGYGDQRAVFFIDPTKTYYVFVQGSEAPVNGPFTLQIMPSFPQELLPLTAPSALNNPSKCSQALYKPDWSYYGKDLSLNKEGDVVTLYANGYDPDYACLWTVSTQPGLTLDFEVLFLDTQSGYCNTTAESCSDYLVVYPEKDLITGAITTKAQSFQGYGAGTQISDLGTTALVYFEPNSLVQMGGFMVQVKAVAQPDIPVATTFHCMPGLNTSFAVSVAEGQAQTIAALSLQPNLRCTYNVTVPPGKGLVISTIAAEMGLESGVHFALVKDAAGKTYSLNEGSATLPNGAGPFTIILTTGRYIYSAQGVAFSLSAEDTYTAPPPGPVNPGSPFACPAVPAPTASILVLNCTNATQGALTQAIAAGKSVRLVMIGDAADTCVFNVSTASTATLSVTTECLGISEVTDVIRIHSDSGFQAAVTGSADGRVFQSLGSKVRLAYQRNPFDTDAQIPAAYKRGGFSILVSSVLRSGAPAASRGDPLPTCPTPKGRPNKSVFLCSGITDQLINGRRPRTPDVGYLTLLADSYEAGVSCTWRVRAPVGSSISLNVTCMDTEPFFDYLTITNGVSTFRYSGYNKTQHPSFGDDVTITFQALPGSIPRSGFELSYEFVEGWPLLVRPPLPQDVRRDVCPPPAANETNLLLCNPFNDRDGSFKTVYPKVGETGAFYLKDPRFYAECLLYVVAPPGYEAVFDIDCLDLYDPNDFVSVGNVNAAGGGFFAAYGPITNETVPAGPTGRFLYYSWSDQQKTSGFLIHYRVQPIASPPVRPSKCDTAIAAAAPATLTCDRNNQDLELLTIGAGTGRLVMDSYVSFQRCAVKLRANVGLVFKNLKFTCVDLEYDWNSGAAIEEIQVTSSAGQLSVSSADSGTTITKIQGVGLGRNVEILFEADESVELSGFVITWTVGTA